ncbi:MAG: hypothetical protein J6V58_03810, partial [Clostridia bacterium]|nr:hypothetical protein [Clostridia bacterium]
NVKTKFALRQVKLSATVKLLRSEVSPVGEVAPPTTKNFKKIFTKYLYYDILKRTVFCRKK